MSSKQRTSKTEPARPKWLSNAILMARLLAHYDRDACFGTALLNFYDEWRDFFNMHPVMNWRTVREEAELIWQNHRQSNLTIYVQALAIFAKGFHLDVIGENAVAAVHGWCVEHHQYPNAFPPSSFSVGSPVSGGWSMHDAAVSIQVDTTWIIDGETYKQVCNRIDALCRTQVRAVLNRIRNESASGESGFVFPSAQITETAKHIDWLYERIAHEKSCFAISIDDGDPDADASEVITESGVRKATDRMARRLGIEPSAIPTPR